MVSELGTTPLVTVFVPALCGFDVHALSVYAVYATVPPAVVVAPLSVDESLTGAPMLVLVVDSVVAIDGEFFPTTTCSLVQGLVAPLLFGSPRYTACQK